MSSGQAATSIEVRGEKGAYTAVSVKFISDILQDLIHIPNLEVNVILFRNSFRLSFRPRSLSSLNLSLRKLCLLTSI